jgi:hypothetical protein
VGSFATQGPLRLTATQSEVAAIGVALAEGFSGNLATGSALRVPQAACAAIGWSASSDIETLAAIGISVTITTATGCSQKATGPEQDKAANDEMPVTVSNIRSDEEVVFFPTGAHFDEDGKTWTVPIHGIIYEPEADSRKCHAIVRALARTLPVEEGTAEAENVDRRLRLFLVDNERGKSLYVCIGGKVYDVGTSGPKGHFQGMLRFSAMCPQGDGLSLRI